jgi:hypothetical protein
MLVRDKDKNKDKAVLSALLLFLALLLAAQSAGAEPHAPVRRPDAVLELANLMTPADFRAAGLDRLSAAELATLDDWVGAFMVRALSARLRAGCSQPVESRVDGDFEGWDGNTLFQLENGQVWAQRGTASRYEYRVSPAVLIYETEAGCTMQVDGMEGEVPVERLR